jgi:kojibiose phosphorylase
VLTRKVLWRAPGATLRIESERFLSLADPRIAAMKYLVTVEKGTASLVLETGFDLDAPFRGQNYLKTIAAEARDGALLVLSETVGTGIPIAVAARVAPSPGAKPTLVREGQVLGERFELRLGAGQSFGFAKVVAFSTSQDAADDMARAALAAAADAARAGYDALRRRHVEAWAAQWAACAVSIEGDERAERGVRYSMFQLLGAASRHDERVSLGAKLLSGEGYRHHVFWDTDLFMMPMFLYTQPEMARLFMCYRYWTLDGARRNAADHGYRGAWYPWESADDGLEACPTKWIDEAGQAHPIFCGEIEIHIVGDVAEALRRYVAATGDEAFVWARGVEMLLEIGRFWVSRVTWNKAAARCELHAVMGPDEWHGPVNNSAYTNVLAQRALRYAVATAERMRRERPAEWKALAKRLALEPAELDEMTRTADAMFIPYDPARKLYVEFDGFDSLTPVEGDPRQANMLFLTDEERNHVKITKQADVLMLLFLLWPEHGLDVLRANWDYYVPLTEHNTSLSASTHAIMAAWLGQVETAYAFFMETAEADLGPVRPDTDGGLHGAAMGGTWMALVHGLCGIRFAGEHVEIEPHLPAHWRRVTVPLVWRGIRFRITLSPKQIEVTNADAARPLPLRVAGKLLECPPAERRVF